ncbi:MAG: hypothetical protein K6F61_11710 [Clostridiales bacterium]|nr:hypothetical protein [Clostridiales bacterium]
MHDLYSEKDLQELSGQLKKRYLAIGCFLAVILAVFVVSIIIRAEWLSIASFILFFAGAVFAVDLFCLPLRRYRKLIASALTGRTHTEEMVYEKTEDDTSVVDGVPCLGMIFLGAPDKHGTREQRFYWDRELPLPDFTPGDQVTLKYTGRNIIGYQK